MDETFNIHYVGNPHLKAIVPRNDRSLGLPELFTYVRRPVVFASAGGLAGQKDLLEASPVFDDLMSRVSGLHASYMMFDPKQDRALVGSSEKQADYFFPLTSSARDYLELLKTTRRNVEELKL